MKKIIQWVWLNSIDFSDCFAHPTSEVCSLAVVEQQAAGNKDKGIFYKGGHKYITNYFFLCILKTRYL